MLDRATSQDVQPRHPLEPLTAVEITRVVEIVRAEEELPPGLLFEVIELKELITAASVWPGPLFESCCSRLPARYS